MRWRWQLGAGSDFVGREAEVGAMRPGGFSDVEEPRLNRLRTPFMTAYCGANEQVPRLSAQVPFTQ
jgi:hypothetical protein